MLQQMTTSIRRRAVDILGARAAEPAPMWPAEHPVLSAQAEIGMLRGVTTAAADVNECTCPESCERDHANE